MWENTDQKNSECRQFFPSAKFVEILTLKRHLPEILLMSYRIIKTKNIANCCKHLS